LRDAQNRHQAAWRRLTALLGVTEMDPVSLGGNLEDDLPELSWEDSRQHVLSESPEMAEARTGVQRAQCEVVRQNAEWIPNVDVQAGVRYDDAASDTVAIVEVGMPLPIFNRNQGNICAARAQLMESENEVRRVELALQDRLATVFKQYDSARRDARQYAAEILPNAKASLDLVQTGYRKGEFDYLTLLTAQRTFYRVNLAYLESLLQEKSSRARIECFLLTGGLDAGG
jgi:outer membrane protein, heavy metal efflux system